ncbi:Bax inhibitor-1/YccA family protein [Deltaproteobacteria bacterium TL4]
MFNTNQAIAVGVQPVEVASVGERLNFLKKVYSLLAASVGTATLGAFLGAGPLFPVVAPHLILFSILEFALIFFAMSVQRKPGLNIVALFSFTTMTGLTLGPLLLLYGQSTVVEALMLTTLTFVGLTAYVFFSKKDFSYLAGFVTTGLIIVIVGGLINLFMQNSMLHFAISGIGVFLFSAFILYDTSNILRRYSTDDYVMATLALYLDVLNLFIMLLHLLGMGDD